MIYYLQLCGRPGYDELPDVYGEMSKACQRLGERTKKEEMGLRSYQVYDESFVKWLTEVGALEEWQSKWQVPIYNDYTRQENLKWMLDRLSSGLHMSKAYVLGIGVGIEDWIECVADKVHGVDFYLEFLTKGVEELQERLLEEYGMLSQVNLVTQKEFGKVRLQSKEPVLVIDYSGSLPISIRGLGKGSIWIDMDSMEEKRHVIEDRCTGLTYLSLKTIWKREMLETLDTICKFDYNT